MHPATLSHIYCSNILNCALKYYVDMKQMMKLRFLYILGRFKTAQEKKSDDPGMNSSMHSRNPSYILFKLYNFDLGTSLQSN